MKKIAILCLALVLALGALGIGYASWVDTVIISGTVNTGSLDLNPVLYSSTYIYKDLDEETIATYHVVEDASGAVHCDDWDPYEPTNKHLVASAVATSGGEDAVTFTYDGLFPCQTLTCDVVLKYEGSVPAKVNDIDWTITSGNDWLGPLVLSGDLVGYARIFDPETHTTGDVVEEGYQLHDGDYVVVWVNIHLPQDDTLMNKSGSVSGHFQVIQWNEYGYGYVPVD